MVDWKKVKELFIKGKFRIQIGESLIGFVLTMGSTSLMILKLFDINIIFIFVIVVLIPLFLLLIGHLYLKTIYPEETEFQTFMNRYFSRLKKDLKKLHKLVKDNGRKKR